MTWRWLISGQSAHWSLQVIGGVAWGAIFWQCVIQHAYIAAAFMLLYIYANACMLAGKVK